MSGGNYDRSKKKSILNPTVGYAFALQVEAAFMLPCRSVRVFTKENDFDYYQEGGLNDYVHMLRKPITRPFTFQVERYVGVSASADFNIGFVDPLTLGTDLILPVILFVNRSPAPDWGDNFSFTNCARAYVFTGCTVTAKEYGELNAEQSRLLTETTTIAYRELFTINQISPSWESGGVWKFKDGDYLGEGESHKENRTSSNLSKQDMTDPTKNKNKGMGLWTLNPNDPYTGSGVSHDINKNNVGSKDDQGKDIAAKDLSKQDMMDKSKNDRAGVWTYNQNDPYTGSGTSHDINKSNAAHKDAGGQMIPAKDFTKADMLDPSRNSRAGTWTLYPNDPYTGSGTSHDINKNNVAHMDAGGQMIPARDYSKAEMVDPSRNPRAGVWTLEKDDPYTGSGTSHEQNRNVNPKATPSRWTWNKDDPYTGSGDAHEQNRNKNEKAAPSKWTWNKDDPYTGSGDAHEQNRNKNEKAAPSKWTWNKDDPYTGSGDAHEQNRNKNEKAEPSKWTWNDGDPYTGSGDAHEQNRNKNEKASPSQWTWNEGDPYTGSGDAHEQNRNKNEKASPSQWTWNDGDPYTGSGDAHERNRNKNEKATPSQWTYNEGDPYTGSGDAHEHNRNKNEKATPSQWTWNDGDPYTGSGDAHERNRNKNEKATPSQWTIDESTYTGSGDAHERNRNKNEKASPSQWTIDEGSYTGGGDAHEQNRNSNEKADPSLWVYDGSVSGSGDSHTANRNKNEKAAPSIFPPNRRARMAKELSK